MQHYIQSGTEHKRKQHMIPLSSVNRIALPGILRAVTRQAIYQIILFLGSLYQILNVGG